LTLTGCLPSVGRQIVEPIVCDSSKEDISVIGFGVPREEK